MALSSPWYFCTSSSSTRMRARRPMRFTVAASTDIEGTPNVWFRRFLATDAGRITTKLADGPDQTSSASRLHRQPGPVEQARAPPRWHPRSSAASPPRPRSAAARISLTITSPRLLRRRVFSATIDHASVPSGPPPGTSASSQSPTAPRPPPRRAPPSTKPMHHHLRQRRRVVDQRRRPPRPPLARIDRRQIVSQAEHPIRATHQLPP